LILADVNVLIYAFRTDADEHPKYKGWLESVVNGAAAYGVSPQVLSGVIRVCTHSRVFARPSTLKDTLAFCQALLDPPNAVIVSPGERHWSVFHQLCREADARGNLVQDAWFAALAIESGCEWITTDRDYARFTSLKWRTPFQ
jgi:hypothetical protein